MTEGELIWRLDGGVEYDFPAGTSIPTGGRLVIVGFDPLIETSRLSSLATAYGGTVLEPGVQIFGPWQGNLSNSGERIALEKMQPSDNSTDPAGWAVVDEVVYSDVAPWPTAPDGQGSSLERIALDETRQRQRPRQLASGYSDAR